MSVNMNNDGTVINATRIWRDVELLSEVEIKSFEEAYEEALHEMGNNHAYELSSWRWGYKESGVSADQNEMKIFYHFFFDPKNETCESEYEPQTIEIMGHEW